MSQPTEYILGGTLTEQQRLVAQAVPQWNVSMRAIFLLSLPSTFRVQRSTSAGAKRCYSLGARSRSIDRDPPRWTWSLER